MMSGMRNAPPISISSPRDTIASRPSASVLSTIRTAAGIVVDHGRVLGAGQLAQQAAQMIVALAALAVGEIELQRDRVAHRRDCRLDGLLGDQRAAEIGVQHRAGEIEHRPQARLRAGIQPRQRACDGIVDDRARQHAARAAPSVARTASTTAGRPKRSTALGCGGRTHHLVDRGKPARLCIRHRVPHEPERPRDEFNVPRGRCGCAVDRGFLRACPGCDPQHRRGVRAGRGSRAGGPPGMPRGPHGSRGVGTHSLTSPGRTSPTLRCDERKTLPPSLGYSPHATLRANARYFA